MREPNIKKVPLMWLKPYPRNNKRHPKKQIEDIARNIKKLGYRELITAEQDGTIIGGHGRWEALKLLVEQGYEEFKNIYVAVHEDLTPREAAQLRIAFNKLADGAEYDFDALQAEVAQFKMEDIELDVLGFSDDELANFMSSHDLGSLLADLDSLQKPPAGPSTEVGASVDDAGLPPRNATYKSAFLITVECKDEKDQEYVYSLMTGHGYRCRVLTA